MLIGRVFELLSYLRANNFQGSRPDVNIKIFILSCTVPLFFVSSCATYFLMNNLQTEHHNLTISHKNSWKPIINISENLTVEFNIQFPISYQFLTEVKIKNSENRTISRVTGASNICRMGYTLNRCLIGLKDDCPFSHKLSREESHTLNEILYSFVLC